MRFEMINRKILILGGYGNFGKRIAEDLSSIQGITLLIAGRNINKAQTLVNKLTPTANAQLTALAIDINSESFRQDLKSLSPFLVIHTGGPFQNQDHRVPKACIEADTHYIDLADDSKFVCDIQHLNQEAKAKNLLIISGASSVPGLSSAVLDYYQPQFSSIQDIEIAIAPGNKAERGAATIGGILSYIGKPIPGFKNGKQFPSYGWMNIQKVNFGGIIGKRWLANVDVPDLSIYPTRYNVKGSVSFQAGLELTVLHLTMNIMAWLTKLRLFQAWNKLTKPIYFISKIFSVFGTNKGAMRISINGEDGRTTKKIIWTLFADNGVGPYIPTVSAIIMARKLIFQGTNITGAMPCLGLYELADFSPYIESLGLTTQESCDG